MLRLRDWFGSLGQQHRDTVGNPVPAPQARVVQQVLIGEVQQGALVDRADEDCQKCLRQGHDHLLR